MQPPSSAPFGASLDPIMRKMQTLMRTWIIPMGQTQPGEEGAAWAPGAPGDPQVASLDLLKSPRFTPDSEI
uniref:Alternative protein CD19 n=1 Tax=Homo sapiens TaxID=9606 RepID=L8E9X3_HUMAN|nr:alternative protein CD19 [Homo sapiens]